MRNKVLKISVLVLIAIFLGFMIGFALFGVAMGHNQFLMPYGTLSLFYVGFLICGLVIGSISPKRWLLAGLTTWAAIALGIVMLNMAQGKVAATPGKVVLLLIILPLICAFLGGYAGRLLGKKMRVMLGDC
jgi:peptidoglycan/LPS O-acetylase OafA/YrhL